MQHVVLYTVCLHGPAGACTLVASESPIHVFQYVYLIKHCGAHKHSLYTHVIQNNLKTPQLAGFACQLGCKSQLLSGNWYIPLVESRLFSTFSPTEYNSIPIFLFVI